MRFFLIFALSATLAAQTPQNYASRYLLLPEKSHVPVAWLVFNGLQAGALVADVEGTQHCLKAHTCVEGNPLMASSRGRAYGVGFSIEGLSAGASWLVRKHRGWWALPLEGVGVHAAGAVSGWSK
jgi:hypothetical protein